MLRVIWFFLSLCKKRILKYRNKNKNPYVYFRKTQQLCLGDQWEGFKFFQEGGWPCPVWKEASSLFISKPKVVCTGCLSCTFPLGIIQDSGVYCVVCVENYWLGQVWRQGTDRKNLASVTKQDCGQSASFPPCGCLLCGVLGEKAPVIAWSTAHWPDRRGISHPAAKLQFNQKEVCIAMYLF